MYRRWRFRALGLAPGPVDAQTAWAFFRLDEAAREIEAVRLARAVNHALVGAFGSG